MPSVFISYAAADKSIAKRLASDLRESGTDVWFDEEQILAGDSITDRIQDGLRASDYIIVLLSENSRHSKWVMHEIGAAFQKYGEKAHVAILPVRIDRSPPPEYLADIRYIDFSEDYQEALKELLRRFEKDRTEKLGLRELINAKDLAADMAVDRTRPRGPEFYITTALALLTIVVTLVTAWPSFKTVFGRIPKVYYDVKAEAVTLPAGVNEEQVLQALEKEGIAPAGLRIRVINKGQAKASEVKIGATTKGSFLYGKTTPAMASRPVWVDISFDDFSNGDNNGRFTLKGLVPEKPVVCDLGFRPKDANYSCDVVADGTLAILVPDIDFVLSWSVLHAFKAPITVLIIGFIISLMVGVAIAAKRNPRIRGILLSVIDTVTPGFGKVLRLFYQ